MMNLNMLWNHSNEFNAKENCKFQQLRKFCFFHLFWRWFKVFEVFYSISIVNQLKTPTPCGFKGMSSGYFAPNWIISPKWIICVTHGKLGQIRGNYFYVFEQNSVFFLSTVVDLKCSGNR